MRLVKISYLVLYSVWIFFVAIDIQLHGVHGSSSPAEVDRYLALGVQMLAVGNLHEALSQFHAAIDRDANNYLSYYRRATVYLALGRSRSGLQDLNKVLQMKPDLTAARMQRATVHYKMGELDLAHIELEEVLRREGDHAEASEMYTSLEPLKQKIAITKDYSAAGDYATAIPLLNELIETCPWAAWARSLRIAAHEAVGDLPNAITDLRVNTKLTMDNTEGFLHLATLYYRMGEVQQTLGEVRECLKLDPDHKACFSLYKKVKKVNKQLEGLQEKVNNKQFEECADSAYKILKEEPSEGAVRYWAHEKLCTCERELGNTLEARQACNSALEHTQDPRVYCERAELHIVNSDYEEATTDFQNAMNIDDNFQRAKEGMQKVQKLKKQAGKRDYYKILGVTRTSTKKEISKAYRQMAQKWHPDRFDGEEQKVAQKKFIDIAAAKEVLTNDEMRQKFNNGEDPMDPEQQQPQHFHHGFNPFQHFHGGGGGGPGGGDGGGNFKFKFHF